MDAAKTRLLQRKGAEEGGSSAEAPPDSAMRRHEAAGTDKRPANAGFFFAVFPPRAATRRQAPTGSRGPDLDGVWTPEVRCRCGHWLHARDVYEHLALVHGVPVSTFLEEEGATEGGIP